MSDTLEQPDPRSYVDGPTTPSTGVCTENGTLAHHPLQKRITDLEAEVERLNSRERLLMETVSDQLRYGHPVRWETDTEKAALLREAVGRE